MRRLVAVSCGVVGLVVGLLVGTALVPSSAEPTSHERLLVLGDSISGQYTDDPGDPMQGWWSMLGQRHGWETVVSAQAGGGLMKKGYGCYGTAVRERAASVIRRVRPTVIVVALGYNDIYVCKNGSGIKMSPTFRATAAAKAFQQIGDTAEAVGMRRSEVVVTVPWGTLRGSDRSSVVLDYRKGALAAGLSFVNVPRFTAAQTRDLTHPNRIGSQLLADLVGRLVMLRLDSRPAAAEPAARQTTPAAPAGPTESAPSSPAPTGAPSASPDGDEVAQDAVSAPSIPAASTPAASSPAPAG